MRDASRRQLIAALLLAPLVGCGGYGEVSPKAYDYATALYSLTSRQSADRLDAVAAQIDAEVERGELPQREAAWLHAILDDARRGDWDDARRAARRMMEDQVRR